ncbi:MAG: biotin synthase BioB [Rhodospirillales bacterium]
MDAPTGTGKDDPRHDWRAEEIAGLFELPFNDLLYKAHRVFRLHWDVNRIQVSSLISIKTGGCAEDCHYCSQSAHFDTGIKAQKTIPADQVIAAAREAKADGAGRFCMGAAWRELKDRDLDSVVEMIAGVRALGLETCMTLGMLTAGQAETLKEAGLDYYNHNIDTSEEFFPKIVTTRAFDERLRTLQHVRDAGINICSGGIVGMGESRADRAGMLTVLANMSPHPQSVPINMLVPIEGTPLEGAPPLDVFEMVRTVAAARLVMPKSHVRLSAGRNQMSEEAQALCFFAGANSVFSGEKLLTAANRQPSADAALFERLGLKAEEG